MKTRNLTILAIVTAVVVIIAGAAVVWRQSESRRTVVESALFPGLIDRLDDVQAIEITAGADSFRIARAGENWVVPAKADFPARFDLVRKALIQIGELKTIEAKTADPERHPDLGLAAPAADVEGAGRRVRLLGADDAELAALVVGLRARGARDMVYVRRAGDDQAWLARSEIDPGAKPMDWIDSLVVKLPFERIRGGVIRHADGEVVEFSKDVPDATAFELADLPEGAKVASALGIDSLARAIAMLRFDDVAARENAPVTGEPAAVDSYRTFDGMTVEVKAWANAAAGEEPDAMPTFWVEIAASYDPAAAAPAPAPDSGASEQDQDEADAEGEEEEPFDPAAETERMVARTGRWAFQVPDFKGEQFTMRRADLIEMPKPEPATAEGGATDEGGAAAPPEPGAGAAETPLEGDGEPTTR